MGTARDRHRRRMPSGHRQGTKSARLAAAPGRTSLAPGTPDGQAAPANVVRSTMPAQGEAAHAERTEALAPCSARSEQSAGGDADRLGNNAWSAPVAVLHGLRSCQTRSPRHRAAPKIDSPGASTSRESQAIPSEKRVRLNVIQMPSPRKVRFSLPLRDRWRVARLSLDQSKQSLTPARPRF